MLFNSLEFLIFLPTVFCLYWYVFQKNLRVQNFLLLISSYVFYGWWDYRFLSLIFLSTVIDYFVGLKIYEDNNKKTKKKYLWISILFNLVLLGFFKYFNFFIDSWIDLLTTVGYDQKSTWTLNVILPVGISFYTFQTMSYTLDIYHEKLKPTKDFISFASFVSFFPQLVAGPIERASNLLPQILNSRVFKYEQGAQGLRLILWGMFKKVVIADSLAPYTEIIFENYSNLNGGVLVLGLLYFSFQIYCDFSGYSDIAIGIAKLFSLELMSNFKFPYFSRDIGEFWRRWHISLSTWFRDYLYIPLGGSKSGMWLSIRNIFIIFIVSGFWHGANWTFIMWGLMHVILYIPLFLKGKNRRYTATTVAEDKWLPTFKELFQMGSTFFFIMVTWSFFRAGTINDAIIYICMIITDFDFPSSQRFGIIYVIIILVLDWMFRKDSQLGQNYFSKRNSFIFCFSCILVLLLFGKRTPLAFIYFQF